MRILAVETSGPRGGIALLELREHSRAVRPACAGPGAPAAPPEAPPLEALLPEAPPPALVLEETVLAEGLRHGRDLVPAVKVACERAGWNPKCIGLVAVSIGPGSFTGIRIAVVLAKTVAYDTGAKVVAVPSLLALAHNAPADRRRVAAVIDAKRGGLFASVFERQAAAHPRHSPAPDAGRAPSAPDAALRQTEGRHGPQRRQGAFLLDEFAEIFGPSLIEPEELARHLQPPAFVIGRGIVKGRAALARYELASEDLWDIRPRTVGLLGAELFARGQVADPLRLEPVYIRPPEAEEIWQRRHGGGSQPAQERPTDASTT